MAYGNRGRRSQGQQYDNTNRGILFENEERRNDKAPDFKGSINVDGRDYWISGWWKDTKRGPGISLSVEDKDSARRGSYESRRPPSRGRSGGYGMDQRRSRPTSDRFPDDDPQAPFDYRREPPRQIESDPDDPRTASYDRDGPPPPTSEDDYRG